VVALVVCGGMPRVSPSGEVGFVLRICEVTSVGGQTDESEHDLPHCIRKWTDSYQYNEARVTRLLAEQSCGKPP
jgi:hypothetical protein